MIPAVIERCAGIDVGRRFIDVCVMIGEAQAEPTEQTRRFSTLNEDLERMRQWLKENQVTHAVMESTGSYWRPIHNILDDGAMEVLLANSQHVKNLRGHKTDRNDARWLAHLLRHGMIRPSFIPERETRELRELTRRRKQMVGCAADERNRVQRVLQEANVQLGTVLSDVFGQSGLSMIDALMKPDATPEEIAELAVRQARKKIPVLKKALEGHRLTDHHRKLIRHSMEHLAFLEEEIAELDQEIREHLKSNPHLRQATELAQSVNGIKETAAAALIAETGADMGQFPNAGKLANWIGTCPGNNITGGKRKNGKTCKGNPWARRVLVECAWSATRKKGSEAQRHYERLKPRLQHKRALMATAHLLTLNLYAALATGRPHAEHPQAELTTAKAQRLVRHHSRRLKTLNGWLQAHRERCAQMA
jgi:transposase